ncbi:hypothetical protein DMH04_27030 [Kibdelosporangium aridum]|uniref:Exo-alpha-sialidase n=1 Tax=Kibdelosporangium aridum TaxID=2030 RepID=A0A428Z5A8_KIBAR|nr:hypothetical protein [Kibdelosporangium aridum]RSM81994.1 hypothetical protein DMH04_27030 [Kibdelosporangium aridum]
MTRRWPTIRKLVTIATLGTVAAACSQTSSPSSSDTAPEVDPGLAHVHGLGVDPADGTLYAASHYGLFRIPATGPPERVTDRRQDTMGFTVLGPRHFLGSGHPDPRDDGPKHLGLIESTDAGQSWRSLSLTGKADFHALEAKHNQVYGHDSQSGQLMVTTDRQNWDPRARLALADFAVSPTNQDLLLATTQQGLTRSSDGGRTFTPIPNAPPLLLVDWPTADTLVGVDMDGNAYTSQDTGTTWSRQGQVHGKPEALIANGAKEVHVATETGIHTSHDGGRTFPNRRPLT